MKKSAQRQNVRQHRHATQGTAESVGGHADFSDFRGSAASQRELMGMAQRGSRLVAQREMADRIHGGSRLVAQRKLMMGEREIHRKTLFSGSAFKDRLTANIDKQVEESKFSLSRDDVRNELLNMIDDGDTHAYEDTHAAVGAAVKKAIDNIYGNIDVSLIFGMDGRNLEQVKNAIEVGYRNFDCAQSYGNTGVLAQAIKDSGVDRGEFKVCYKFDVANGESADVLETRLLGVAAQFGGRLDDVMIHNLDAPQAAIESAWRVLNKMKGDGAAVKVGVGNVGAKDGALLSTLGGIGKIDVVENSISSLLASPAIAEMIKKSGAEVYFYDIIKTAKEIGVNSEAGIKALIGTIAGQHASSTAIMSSGDAHRQSRNIRKFGDGSKLQEIDFENAAESEAAIKVHAWRNKQSCDANDEGFALPGAVATWIGGIMDDTGQATRERIKQAATDQEKKVDPEFIQSWLNANGGPTHAQQLFGMPARTGLKKRYLGMPLGNVLAALFGSSSCDWKWSWQLVQLMMSSVDNWNQVLKFGADEIVAE